MTDYEKARKIALSILEVEKNQEKSHIAEIAKSAIQSVKLISSVDYIVDVDESRLVRDLESLVTFNIGRSFVVDEDVDHIRWLPTRGGEIKWNFWNRYRRYLTQKSKPLPPAAVDSIDQLTDRVLERLEDPNREGPWDRRGMIVGDVQSGKTGNFVGLVCKAADAGYKIIVVLAGTTDNLRAQTQLRIDEGFLGYSASKATRYSSGMIRPTGVGKILTDYQAIAHSLTGYESDFSRFAVKSLNINPNTQDPVILVVKKNVSILANLLVWLAGYAENDPEDSRRKRPLPNAPLLVIDDEADQASINTKPIPTDPTTGLPLDDYDITAINKKIRQLLRLFSKSAYIGYTATPFANIFIHPEARTGFETIQKNHDNPQIEVGEGLFPRSFIISLPTPADYIGPGKIFGIDPDPETGIGKAVQPLPIKIPINDGDDFILRKHKKDFVPSGLPASLRSAIRSFILTCAARACRGEVGEHNSMLVHVTRYIDVQKCVRDLIEEEMKTIKNRLKYGDGASTNQIMKEFEVLWNEDFRPKTKAIISMVNDPMITTVNWKEMMPLISIAAQKISVKRISGGSEDVLDYQNSPDGVSVIAVGGDKLSRGLTLEGLSISYFLRPSTMYDTLMQMGRWFGYRRGYLDLCRLYTTSELADWYKDIAFAAEELRYEFELMSELNLTPRDYGLRIRSNPKGLLITSLVKMREGHALRVSYDGRIVETTTIQSNENLVKQNLDATRSLIGSLPRSESEPHIWSDVAAESVISFLSKYNTHPHAPMVNSRLLAEYIKRKSSNGVLVRWTIAIISKGLSD